MWNRYKTDPATNLLTNGEHSGTFGDLADPEVTIVTGSLTVGEGGVFRGAGILVIRDDYDPNVDTNNTPDTYAALTVNGKLEWTGLVVISGWKSDILFDGDGTSVIVGALMGEDSVQSGGERDMQGVGVGGTVMDLCVNSASLLPR